MSIQGQGHSLTLAQDQLDMKIKTCFSQKPLGHFRVLTRILKIGVKCCCPEKVGVLPYFSIETFQKVGVRNEKLE